MASNNIVNQIYYYDAKYNNALKLLEQSSSISKEDKEAIKEFIDHLRSQGVSVGRLAKYLFHLRVFREQLGKNFREASRKDIEHFMASAREKYAYRTVEDYGFAIKRFYKYLYYGNVDKDTPWPDLVKWIKKSSKPNQRSMPELLTPQELQKMIEAAENLRDKTMLAVGFEAGLRAAELLSMNTDDVSFDSLGARIRVKGKTGERLVRLISSAPILAMYMEVHPFRDEPGKPLWPSYATNRRGLRLSYILWNRILKKIAIKAGIKKRVHNHMLRHGSATEAAKYLTEPEMRIKYGWSGGSRMPEVYVHLSSRDLDDKLARIYTGKVLETPKPKFSPIICPKCSEKNSPGQRYCGRCGTPLDKIELEKRSIELEALKRELMELKELLSKAQNSFL
ncbi:MAG: site-specific integrase [Nitrososphaeria archaeon]|nr:site-specific integrase [Nitrososphaeria archaeon]